VITEREAREIIWQALLDNGREVDGGYRTSLEVEELAEQIAYRLGARGAFLKSADD